MIRRRAFTVKKYRWKHFILGLQNIVTKIMTRIIFLGKKEDENQKYGMGGQYIIEVKGG